MLDGSLTALFATTLAADGCDLDTAPVSGARETKPATKEGRAYAIKQAYVLRDPRWLSPKSRTRTLDFCGRATVPTWRVGSFEGRRISTFPGGKALDALLALRPDLSVVESCKASEWDTPVARLLACLDRVALPPGGVPSTPAPAPVVVPEESVKPQTEPGKLYQLLCHGSGWVRLDAKEKSGRWMRMTFASFYAGGPALDTVLARRPDLEPKRGQDPDNKLFDALLTRYRARRGVTPGEHLLAHLDQIPAPKAPTVEELAASHAAALVELEQAKGRVAMLAAALAASQPPERKPRKRMGLPARKDE